MYKNKLMGVSQFSSQLQQFGSQPLTISLYSYWIQLKFFSSVRKKDIGQHYMAKGKISRLRDQPKGNGTGLRFFVASQGGQHPQLEPDVGTYFLYPQKVGCHQFFRISLPIPKKSFIFSLIIASPFFAKKVTKISIFVLKRIMFPRMAICHAFPKLHLNHLIF